MPGDNRNPSLKNVQENSSSISGLICELVDNISRNEVAKGNNGVHFVNIIRRSDNHPLYCKVGASVFLKQFLLSLFRNMFHDKKEEFLARVNELDSFEGLVQFINFCCETDAACYLEYGYSKSLSPIALTNLAGTHIIAIFFRNKLHSVVPEGAPVAVTSLPSVTTASVSSVTRTVPTAAIPVRSAPVFPSKEERSFRDNENSSDLLSLITPPAGMRRSETPMPEMVASLPVPTLIPVAAQSSLSLPRPVELVVGRRQPIGVSDIRGRSLSLSAGFLDAQTPVAQHQSGTVRIERMERMEFEKIRQIYIRNARQMVEEIRKVEERDDLHCFAQSSEESPKMRAHLYFCCQLERHIERITSPYLRDSQKKRNLRELFVELQQIDSFEELKSLIFRRLGEDPVLLFESEHLIDEKEEVQVKLSGRLPGSASLVNVMPNYRTDLDRHVQLKMVAKHNENSYVKFFSDLARRSSNIADRDLCYMEKALVYYAFYLTCQQIGRSPKGQELFQMRELLQDIDILSRSNRIRFVRRQLASLRLFHPGSHQKDCVKKKLDTSYFVREELRQSYKDKISPPSLK